MEAYIAYLLLAAYGVPITIKLIQVSILIIKENKGTNSNKLPLKKIASYSIMIILPIILGFGVISHTNYFDYEKPKPYDSINSITFKNFRGIELLKKTLYGNEKFAYIVTSLETKINKNSVTVIAFFHPSSSFVYSQQSNSKELLRHELYHFKITELYARLIKQEIGVSHSTSKDSIKLIIKTGKILERGYQKKYDYDTFHSYVFSEQKKYEREIDSLLNQLIEYKKSRISIR